MSSRKWTVRELRRNLDFVFFRFSILKGICSFPGNETRHCLSQCSKIKSLFQLSTLSKTVTYGAHYLQKTADFKMPFRYFCITDTRAPSTSFLTFKGLPPAYGSHFERQLFPRLKKFLLSVFGGELNPRYKLVIITKYNQGHKV